WWWHLTLQASWSTDCLSVCLLMEKSWAWWHVPVIPATWDGKASGSLELTLLKQLDGVN
uniref:Uncharacterized protein n=1 Tax=Chelonoidis abingdonii TaxID=106734 RepID=A0A8C0J848_CHEAB